VYLFHHQVSVLPALESLLFGQDHFYKISVLAPLKSKSTAEVAKVFITDVVAYYSAPIILQTDNGQEFCGKTVLQTVEERCGCKVVRGRPRHPQTQGSVEKANDAAKKLIQCVGTSACVDWPHDRVNTCSANTRSHEHVFVKHVFM
jgi:hypothetical protein